MQSPSCSARPSFGVCWLAVQGGDVDARRSISKNGSQDPRPQTAWPGRPWTQKPKASSETTASLKMAKPLVALRSKRAATAHTVALSYRPASRNGAKSKTSIDGNRGGAEKGIRASMAIV
ncbi:hypothetical protein VFPFJ_03291 [Purpureocillium lilacinum]|uniref:Uncharacterized protein n=1 Tax=Purpureocillium lilacinum TaxID=33203 RepID=A0A179HPT0_PURLI|nr:hypothetical protein VFPFJ_03291 [Purpureocillium lilacinum]OAQ91551.1 hypothetical protein VFPFJ_03291 [Purpureocillium lilacinum]